MQHYVYVQDKDGNPLMPTKRYGWVRRSLKNGKAVAVCTIPFTIRLTYEPETKITQPVRAGNDEGRINLGYSAVRSDGKCLMRVKVITRNDKIPKLMGLRKTHRMASRRGERLARKRLAVKHHTTMKNASAVRKLPGYKEGTVTVKDIINTEAKFNNRKRPKGWLTPTARQLLLTHENGMSIIRKFLPVSGVSAEINKFDFQKMDNPHIKRWEYGNGPLKGFGTVRKALISLQGGKCLLCGKPRIEHDHHIVPKALGGSDTISNIAGICHECHEKLHHDDKLVEKLSKLKEGLNQKYHHLSVLNQIITYYFDYLAEEFPDEVYAVEGKGTKAFREENGYGKDHDVDAYCIAGATMENITPDHDMPPCYEIRQFRRHDRARIKAQVFRSYYLDGKKVAQNRRKATEVSIAKDGKVTYKKQKFPSLEDWFADMVKKHGQKEAERMRSRLTVQKSYRRYNNTKRPLPGSVFYHEGKRYVMKGQLTGGEYLTAVGVKQPDGPSKDRHFAVSECTIFPNRGLVFVS